MVSIRNVFNSTTLDPEYYQPRNKQTQVLFEVTERTRHSIPHVVLITGEPGIGKSVFLKKVSEELLERNCFVVYLRVAHATFQEFIRDLLGEIFRMRSPKSRFQSELQTALKGDEADVDVAKIPFDRGREDLLKVTLKEFSEHIIKSVGEASVKAGENGILVFLIDQAENLIDISCSGLRRRAPEFLSFLMDHLYRGGRAAKRILFVFGVTKGKYTDFDLRIFGAGKLSSVRRRPIEITPFSDTEIEELVLITAERGEFILHPDVVSEIIKICRGYPNIAQMLGENLQLALSERMVNVPGSKPEVDMTLFKDVAEYTIYELVKSRTDDLSETQKKLLIEASKIVEDNSVVTPRQLSQEKTLGIPEASEIIDQIDAIQSKNLIVFIRGSGVDSEFFVPEWVRAVILQPARREAADKVRMIRVLMRFAETSPAYLIKTGALAKDVIPLIVDTFYYERSVASEALSKMTDICMDLLKRREYESCAPYFMAAVKLSEMFETKEIASILSSLTIVGNEILANSSSPFSYNFMIPLFTANMHERLGKKEEAKEIFCRVSDACENVGDEASLKGYTGYALTFYCVSREICRRTHRLENMERLNKKVSSHLYTGLPGFLPEAYLVDTASASGLGILGATIFGVYAALEEVVQGKTIAIDEKKYDLPIASQVKTLASLDADMIFLEIVFKELQEARTRLLNGDCNQLVDIFHLIKNTLTCIDEVNMIRS